MKIVFLTNYFNDHLKEFSDGLFRIYKSDFIFLETGDTDNHYEKSRIPIHKPEYVSSYSNKNSYLVNEADVVIFGSSPYGIISKRIKEDRKLSFLYQERPLKKGCEPVKFLFRLFKWRSRYARKKNCYILCASSFTSKDYSKFGLFKGKCLRFGYFPNRYKGELNLNKTIDSIFVARLVELKHPEVFVRLCQAAVKDFSSFTACIVGDGPLNYAIKQALISNKIDKNVLMLGYKDNNEVIDIMKQSKTLIFCSDSREGWGAVINEAMSCGCVPFVSTHIGSAEFLIDNGKNGYTFNSFNELKQKFIGFLKSDNVGNISAQARNAIDSEWNGSVAAQRFADLLESGHPFNKYLSGPMSLILNK